MAEWERDFPVERWQVGSVRVWPFLRTWLGSRILTAGRPPQPKRPLTQHPALRMIEESGRALWDGARDGARGRMRTRTHTTPDVVLLGRPSSRQPLGGRFYDSLLDPIADALEAAGRSVSMFEYRSTMLRYRLPRHRPAVAVRSALLAQRARTQLEDALRRPSALQLDRHADFVRAVTTRYPTVRVPHPWWLARRVRDIEAVASYFDAVFAETRPRLAMCTPYYNAVGFGFCLAASRRGIRSVDVQHGVTRGNPAYDRWTSFPSGGYALLPDRVWCWSALDAEPIQAGRTTPATLVGGHPWHAYWDRHRGQNPNLAPLPRGERTVLVSLTWSSGWSEALRAIVSAAPPSWAFWIRLHPLMHAERASVVAWCAEKSAEKSAVKSTKGGATLEVEGASDLPLPVLLQHADVHLTHNSSVVQEAAAVGKPSVVIDDRALDVYTQEIESGIAVYAKTTEGAIEALRRATSETTEERPSEWARLQRAIAELLDEP